MDYIITLDKLSSNQTEIETIKSGAEDIYNEFNSCYLSQISDAEISKIKNSIKSSVERLKKGSTNSNTWYNNYLSETNTLEDSIASITAEGLTTIEEFKGQFIDMFGKKTMPVIQTSGDIHANSEFKGTGALSSSQVATLLEKAESQIGVPYNSMNYGPKEEGGSGFGCAMFVSYCYNNTLFNGASGQNRGSGFYGSTYEYWGNVTKDGYDAYNKGFEEVDPSEAQAGDVLCFLYDTPDPYSSYSNCYHVGLYVGDNQMIDSSNGGVAKRAVNVNDKNVHVLRYVGTNT